MKNTTQRILALGGKQEGCRSFLVELHKNNPLCGDFWHTCLQNNPGGETPDFYLFEVEEVWENFLAEVKTATSLPVVQ